MKAAPPERYRLKTGPLATDYRIGNNGFFIIPHYRISGYEICCMVSDEMGWEHVSVTVGRIGKLATRCPTWEEMCWVKDIFWEEWENVLQYHPPKTDYVSMHPYCLHLWLPIGKAIPIPDSILVGPDEFKK